MTLLTLIRHETNNVMMKQILFCENINVFLFKTVYSKPIQLYYLQIVHEVAKEPKCPLGQQNPF